MAESNLNALRIDQNSSIEDFHDHNSSNSDLKLAFYQDHSDINILDTKFLK